MGSTKNGYVMKCSRTQGSKEILTEMDEGSLRSLEKYLLWEEMVRWRRKSKGKKRVNSDNGGREVEKDEKKGKRERQRKVGGQNSPLTLKLRLRLSKPKKKKLSFLKFSIYPKSQIPNFQLKIFVPKFSNSYSQCSNFEFNSSVFNKNSNFKFHDQDSKPWFKKILKAQNFRF